jgi:hypothetical protein
MHHDVQKSFELCTNILIHVWIKQILDSLRERYEQNVTKYPTYGWKLSAFTQTFDGLMAHMPIFMVDPNGKITISLKTDQT